MESRYHVMVVMPCILAIILFSFGFAEGDVDKDKEKCADQLVGLATCLPYVSGESRAPPMDCCTGFKQVLKTALDCVCLLIKDRDDPSLGLKINSTLALGLPARCNAPSDHTVADCPAILHLPPNSPDAKVFQDFANSAKKSNTTATGPGNSANETTTTTANQKSDGGRRKRWLETQMFSGLVLALVAAHMILFINI